MGTWGLRDGEVEFGAQALQWESEAWPRRKHYLRGICPSWWECSVSEEELDCMALELWMWRTVRVNSPDPWTSTIFWREYPSNCWPVVANTCTITTRFYIYITQLILWFNPERYYFYQTYTEYNISNVHNTKILFMLLIDMYELIYSTIYYIFTENIYGIQGCFYYYIHRYNI